MAEPTEPLGLFEGKIPFSLADENNTSVDFGHFNVSCSLLLGIASSGTSLRPSKNGWAKLRVCKGGAGQVSMACQRMGEQTTLLHVHTPLLSADRYISSSLIISYSNF